MSPGLRRWTVCLVGSLGWLLPLWHPAEAQPSPPSASFSSPASSAPATQPESASGWRVVQPSSFARRAVVTAHPLASRAAYDTLRRGGNAVDAAIAAQWVLGLVEPQSSGPGGGAFVVLMNGQSLSTHDGRETAPAAAHPQQFMVNGQAMNFDQATRSAESVGVPGLVALLWQLHQSHGRLPWADLVRPAIRLAEHGFAMSPRLHRLLGELRADLDPAALPVYFNAHGQAKAVGQRIRNPGYAQLLRDIGRLGPPGFYQGRWGQALLARVNARGAAPWMTPTDLQAYRPQVRPALCHDLAPTAAWPRGLQACGMPPPSSGQLAIGQWLGIWDQLGLRLLTDQGQLQPESLHAWVEAARLAFADRAQHVADPDFVPGPRTSPHPSLTPEYLRERAQRIGPVRMPTAPAGRWPLSAQHAHMPDQPERGTSHLSIVDGQGQVLAMTSTIEQAFGSRRMVGVAGHQGGYWLNNQLTDFSFLPTGAKDEPIANRVQAGKRPRSSMSPMVVLQSTTAGQAEPVMVLGSPGGAAIIGFAALSLQALREGLPAQASTELPHLAVLAPQAPVVVEAQRFPESLVQQLQSRGHAVVRRDLTSGLGILLKSPGGWQTGVDPRREGLALGD